MHKFFLKDRLNSYKSVWKTLSLDQKISLSTLLFLLLTLPVSIVSTLTLTNFFPRATLPITPPVTPVTPPTNTPTTTNIPIPTQITPSITVSVSPTSSITPTPTIASTISPTKTPTATVIPPRDNRSPRVTTSGIKIAIKGRSYSKEIRAIDRDGDEMSMSATNLPNGLKINECDLDINKNNSTLECEVKGIPQKTGIYGTKFIVQDRWGAKSNRTIYFIVLPSRNRK